MDSWTHYRAQIASLSRDRAPDDLELVEARRNLVMARRNLVEAKLADELRRRAPDLTQVQRDRLVLILTGAA